MAASCIVCLGATTCADRAPASPQQPTHPCHPCASCMLGEEGRRWTWRAGAWGLRTGGWDELPSPGSLCLLSLQSLPGLIHLPECRSHPSMPTREPPTLPLGLHCFITCSRSLLGPQALSETWRFSSCACISSGAGEGENEPPTPVAFEHPLTPPSPTALYLGFPFLSSGFWGIWTLWGQYLQHWPSL